MARVMRYDGIPTTRTVRECRSQSQTEWHPLCGSRHHAATHVEHERTVVDPIYVVPQMLPCPECGGARIIQSEWDPDAIGCCPTCGGSGVVAPPWPDYIATDCPECGGTGAEGYVIRYWDAHSWVEPCSSCAAGQVVAYKVTAIDPLPVVDNVNMGRLLHRNFITVDPTHGVWEWTQDMQRWLGDEPWAQNLKPGDLVWRLHLEALDQPYTEMVCPCGLDECPDGLVPLSVPVGEVADIELDVDRRLAEPASSNVTYPAED